MRNDPVAPMNSTTDATVFRQPFLRSLRSSQHSKI